MKPDKYDFSGYVTKNDVVCTDGRIIRQDAFKHDNGRVVPLVWQHNSNDPGNIIGHTVLENRSDGVYGYSTFNDTENAKGIKGLVLNHAVNAMSIHAGKLAQAGQNVISGVIREVSLVMSGANSGATIDNLSFAHSEFGDDVVVESDEAIIHLDQANASFEFFHSEEVVPPVAEVVPPVAEVVPPVAEVVPPVADVEHASPAEGTVAAVLSTLNDAQKVAVGLLFDSVDGDTEAKPDPAVLDTLNADQKAAVGYTIDELKKAAADDSSAADTTATDTSVKHSEMETTHMEVTTNVFDITKNERKSNVLTHENFVKIWDLAQEVGSFHKAFVRHMTSEGYEFKHADGDPTTGPGISYGIANVDMLFPDARAVNTMPEFIKRKTEWVDNVISGTKHSPFSRIKTLQADITEDEARAKGYIKGTQKLDEIFSILGRSTTPTTIYKRNKMDRDDVLDITDFDVIVWLKQEMRLMLDEELARAILISDGRSAIHADKIKEEHVRPIYKEDPLYAIRADITSTDVNDQIDDVVRACSNYQGSGTPSFYASRAVITEMLLVRDTLNRRLYPTRVELAAALGVKEVVEVEVMTGVTNDDNHKPLFGIVVNLVDYTVGADKGGEINSFDQFDINFNQQIYLLETRISGALTKPKSAVILELNPSDEVG